MPDPAAVEMKAERLGPALSATSDAPTGPAKGPALSAVAGKGKPDVALTNAAPAADKPDGKPAAEAAAAQQEGKDKGKTPETPKNKPEGDADPGDEAAPDKTAKADKPEADDGKTDDGKQPKKDETPAWQKAEITKERNKRRAAEQAAADAQKQLADALEAFKNATGKPAADTKDKGPERPKRADFKDPDAYDEALIQYAAATTAAAVKAEAETNTAKQEQKRKDDEQQAAAQKHADQLQKDFRTRFEKAKAEIPDFEEVVSNDDVPVSMAAAQAMMECDNGPAVMYFLGKNPKEAERIAGLTPGRQVIEIGRLSERLEEKPQITKAPPPAKPLASRQRATEPTLHELSMEEYAAKRNAQLRQTTRAT